MSDRARIRGDDAVPGAEPPERKSCGASAPHLAPARVRAKRALDVVAAAAALALLAPLMLAIALAIKLSSPGPVFSHRRQTRAGGKGSRVLAFRTSARPDPDRCGNSGSQRPQSRVTAIGSFLSKTGLDRLPQLINVVKGEMSTVGRRPLKDAQ